LCSYTTTKNPSNTCARTAAVALTPLPPAQSTQKLALMKYDPIVRRHVLFNESKLPSGKKR